MVCSIITVYSPPKVLLNGQESLDFALFRHFPRAREGGRGHLRIWYRGLGNFGFPFPLWGGRFPRNGWREISLSCQAEIVTLNFGFR